MSQGERTARTLEDWKRAEQLRHERRMEREREEREEITEADTSQPGDGQDG